MNTLEDSLRSMLADDARAAPAADHVVRRVVERTRRRETGRRVGLTVGLVAAATAAVVVVPQVLDGRGGDTTGAPVATGTSSSVVSDGPTGEVFANVGTSCSLQYSPKEVSRRAIAFDGTVTAIGPGNSNRGDEGDLDYAGVTFQVHEWFRGGGTGTITIDLDQPGSGRGEIGTEHGPAYGVGSRLLVSGEHRWGLATDDDLIGWTCGFTRYYDPQTAAAWRRAAG